MNPSPIVLSVSELTNAIKSHLEPMFRHIWVRGEISNYRLQSSGHVYFTLIEGDAQLSAVLFRMAASALTQPIKNGDTVIAEGEVSVYPPRGNYQLVVRHLSHVGLGEALLKLQALKKKLLTLGWFRPERKRPIPTNIRTICLVTSQTGAVLHDVITILSRRLGGFHLVVNPVRVQGEGAAQEIARAIAECNAYALADVIIVCRGGGSSEDLAAFNDEIVAAACFQSAIPIISAIGHETDLSIADLVADVRAPTPSAAAELVSHEGFERRHKLSMFASETERLVHHRLHNTRGAVQVFAKRLDQSSPQRRIELHSLRLDDFEASFMETMKRSIVAKKALLTAASRSLRQLAPTTKLTHQKAELSSLERQILGILPAAVTAKKKSLSHIIKFIDERINRRLSLAKQQVFSRDWAKDINGIVTRKFTSLRQQVGACTSNLSALNPERTLERGYAIVFRGNTRQVIRSVQTIELQEPMTIMVSDGAITAHVQTLSKKDVLHGRDDI